MSKIYIYILEHPETDNIRYVGKTNDPQARYWNHCSPKKENRSHRKCWIKSLLEKDLKPNLVVIDEVPEEEWKFWERYWISQFKTWGFNLTNHTHGGDGLTKGNQTSFKKGHTPWNKGKSYSNSKKGQSVPQEVRDKISKTLTGRPSNKKRKVKQYDKDMNFIKEYPSITEARQATGINGIRNVVTGRAKTAGGYIWQ